MAEGPCAVTFGLPASKSRILAYLPWQSALQTIHLSYKTILIVETL